MWNSHCIDPHIMSHLVFLKLTFLSLWLYDFFLHSESSVTIKIKNLKLVDVSCHATSIKRSRHTVDEVIWLQRWGRVPVTHRCENDALSPLKSPGPPSLWGPQSGCTADLSRPRGLLQIQRSANSNWNSTVIMQLRFDAL